MNLGTAGQIRAAALLRGETTTAFQAPFRVGLGVSADDNGLVGEPAGSGYARASLTFGGTGVNVTNANALAFGPFTADLGVVRAIAIFDATGAVMWRGDLSNGLTLGNGATRTIAAGAITATID